jgi:hypothetical protein
VPGTALALAVTVATAASAALALRPWNLLMSDRPLTAVWNAERAPLSVPKPDSLVW